MITPEEIKELLNKSGYLFEQKVASLIESLGFHTTTNRAFLDSDENKSREIDVVAHKEVFRIEGKPPVIGLCYLNCECKNSTTPYVFINRNKGTIDKWYRPDGIFLVYDSFFKRKDYLAKVELDAFTYMGLDSVHFATREKNHAVQICKVVQNGSKKETQHAGVIEGFIYPLVKSKKIWEAQTPVSNKEKKYCKFFFNLAVVNSDVYAIDSEDDSSLPEIVGYVPFTREIRNNYIQGEFLITFVNFDHLRDFLVNEVETFCKRVYDTYLSRPELLTEYPFNDEIIL